MSTPKECKGETDNIGPNAHDWWRAYKVEKSRGGERAQKEGPLWGQSRAQSVFPSIFSFAEGRVSTKY
jgi:hypothetical protein